MSKTRLFIENFLIYGIGGIIGKIIPLVMVPIITRLMPDTHYFGISDMSQTIVSFAQALALFGMYDVMYRMFFEKADDEYKKDVCSTAFVFTLFSSMLIAVFLICCRKQFARFFLGDDTLDYVMCLSAIATFVGATNQIVSAPTRMQNKRKIYLMTNLTGSFLSYGLIIPLLLMGHYIIAYPLAGVLSGAMLEIAFLLLNRRWFDIKRIDMELLSQMLRVAIPIVPSFVFYWIFNSCDRLMITNILGVGAEGIYSVGSKLGHASQLIYMAFAGGWQYFAFSTMNEKDQIKTNTLVFEYLGVISFTTTAFVCAFCKNIYEFLFTEEYYAGYIIAPYLFLAPLLQMLYQVGGNQFLVIKKTGPGFLLLASGCTVNVLLNFALIPKIGIEGAAIGTLIGYVVTVIVAIIVLQHFQLMCISGRFLILSAGMVLYFLIWRILCVKNLLQGMALAIIFFVFCVVMYRSEVKEIMEKIKRGREHYDHDE